MMSATPRGSSDPEWIGRVTLTLIAGCGALATIVAVSNALRASNEMVRVDNSVAELSHFVANSHASIREHVATRQSVDDAIAAFESGADRRIARIRAALKQPAGVAWWTNQLNGGLNFYRIAEDRRAYVAAATAASDAAGDRAAALRRFELCAQKLIVTVDAARDSVDPSRVQALDDATSLVMLAVGMGSLMIAYLVWLPAFGRDTLRTPRAPLGTPRISRIPAIF